MILEIYTVIGAAVVAHFLALLSPGPDFFIVVRSGIKNKRRNAIGVAFGIALANAIYIAICIIGIGAIIAKSMTAMVVLKIVGGLFLTYLAYLSFKAEKNDYHHLMQYSKESDISTSSFVKEFVTGFLSGILNPKNIIFYLSLFSLVLTNEVSLFVKVALGVWMTLLVFFWDAFIIFALSRTSVRSVFSRLAYYIDKLAGVILGVFGAKLLESAVSKN
jgi:threonine/homoserine/homoserine lactone efflux protein